LPEIYLNSALLTNRGPEVIEAAYIIKNAPYYQDIPESLKEKIQNIIG
jgi:hypothetical protein